jgi:hypothetical protein
MVAITHRLRRPAPRPSCLTPALLLALALLAPRAAAAATPPRFGSALTGSLAEFVPALRVPWADSLESRAVFAPGVRSVTVPVEIEGRYPLVRVRVNESEPLRFLLASGLPVSAVDSRVARQLGLEPAGSTQVTGDGGQVATMETARLASLRLGAAAVRGLRVLEFGTGELRDTLALELDGILGYDFLSAFAATFDLGHGSLTLADPATWTPPDSVRAVPLQNRWDIPVMPAIYDGNRPGWFRLNTGSPNWVSVEEPFVRAHRLWRSGKLDDERAVLGLAGRRQAHVMQRRSIKLGRCVVECSWTEAYYPWSGEGTPDSSIDGTLGEAALELLELTLDPARRAAYVEPALDAGAPDPLGWRLERREGLLEVTGVEPGGVAAGAGVEPGDVLLSLGGSDLEDLRPEVVRRLTRGPKDTVVRFRMRRGDAERNVDMLITGSSR